MMRIARLRNPASARNRGRIPLPLPDDILDVPAEGLARLDDALASLRDYGTDLLVVDGGDGTLREVISRLPDVFGTSLPALGILANGNTNLLARHAGRIRGHAALARLAAGAVPHQTRLRALRIDRAEGRPLRGFVLGWGAYKRATQIAAEESRVRGNAQVLLAALVTLRRTLVGPEAAALRHGIAASVSVDGDAQLPGRRFLGIATSLQGSLLPGIEPFWGAGPGAVRWLDVLAPAPCFMLAALAAALGRPLPWMKGAGWLSGANHTLTLMLPEGFVLDGEVFSTGGRPVRVTADIELCFLSA